MKRIICLIALIGTLCACAPTDPATSSAKDPSKTSPSSSETPEFETFNILDSDRILFVKTIENTQHAWETTDPDRIAEIASLFSEMTYGTPEVGGSVGGEFLFIRFFSGDTEIGQINLRSPFEVMVTGGSLPHIVSMQKGHWSSKEWDAFLDLCDK